jgi:phosphoribosyl 1,2-cyclic phosphodiesterase
MSNMKITCFGSRGSLPSPGPQTVKYGGNTTCYTIEAGPFIFVQDGGSGAKAAGQYLMSKGKIGVSILINETHWHSDHMQGLPFFIPLFIGSNTLHFYGLKPKHDTGNIESSVHKYLIDNQEVPRFPVPLDFTGSGKSFTDLNPMMSESYGLVMGSDGTVEQVGSDYKRYIGPSDHDPEQGVHLDQCEDSNFIKITTIPLNHPEDCLGFRYDYMGKTFVFCTDNEPQRKVSASIKNLAQGADLFISDGQYTEDELGADKQGYGHGSPESVIEQGCSIGAKEIVIHHHDPDRTDLQLDDMYIHALDYLQKMYNGHNEPKLTFAKEGKVWEV